ncbi:hypothetical protein [Paraburkholderia sp. GAS334]|uniref:hypothetical protein n=1 Tax=unclassified Paraburkholderia TaxID=2615204 RepID=UPI003D1C0991
MTRLPPFNFLLTMIEVLFSVAGWQQLVQLWELIVLVCKFLWGLLLLLGGG